MKTLSPIVPTDRPENEWEAQAYVRCREMAEEAQGIAWLVPGTLKTETIDGVLCVSAEWALAPVNTEVHGAYLRAALAEAGKLDTILANVDPVKRELFKGATTFRRGEPDLEAGALAFGIDLAATFKRADEIRASRS